MNDNISNNINNNDFNSNNYNNPNVVPGPMNNQQVPQQSMMSNQMQQPTYQQPMEQPNVNIPAMNNQVPQQVPVQQNVPMQQPMYQQPIQPTNKKKDNIIIIVLGLLVVGLIVAILFFLLTGKDDNKEKDSSKNNDNVVTENENNGSSEKEDNKIENNNNNDSTSNKLPSDWTSMEFIFDGVKYNLTTPYTSFKNNGWEIDGKIYPDEYIIKPNTRVVSTVEITNPKYSDTYITIGFLNNTTVEKDITECLVWSINISNDYVDTPVPFELPGGIKYGSSATEIEAAYGKLEEKNLYRSESLKYTVYHYSYDYNKYLDLTVYDDGGLKEISYRVYR